MTTLEYQLDSLPELIELRHRLLFLFTDWDYKCKSNYETLQLKLEVK